MIPPAFVHDLLARTDILEIVGRHVQLKKAGTTHKGLCPFHGEKSPSFTVSASRQTYHCFGCGVHGNAVGFLMEHLGLGFVDAVRDLAQQVGMTVPEDDASPEERQKAQRDRERRGSLTDVLAQASEYYRAQLKASPRAIDYLKGRGLTGEVAGAFALGYAPASWRPLANAFARYDDPLLEESGLVLSQGDDEAQRKRYDRFRDRIMFPIRSVQGEIIGFGARIIDAGEPKYLNSPETPVFVKGRELYGLYEARTAVRQRGHVLVVEGYMDVVALAQLGIPNAVATLGTACTAEHVQKLFRFTEAVVFSFDGDAAGRRAAGRALEASLPHATDTRSIKFLFLPPEHDPDSYVREHGAAAFERCIEQAVPLSRQLVEAAGEDCDLATAEGRSRFLATARASWQQLPDGSLKRQILGDLASTARLSTADLLELWNAAPPARQPAGGGGGAAARVDAAARPSGPRRTARLRAAPAGPPDHALRMLLLQGQWWDRLGPDDQELLHHLPGAHGALCAWLERQRADHGPTPWSALAAALPADEAGDLARRLVSTDSMDEVPDFAELRHVLDRMWIERLKAEETRLIAASAQDPTALNRYREIHERRRRLERPVPPA